MLVWKGKHAAHSDLDAEKKRLKGSQYPFLIEHSTKSGVQGTSYKEMTREFTKNKTKHKQQQKKTTHTANITVNDKRQKAFPLRLGKKTNMSSFSTGIHHCSESSIKRN